jgi:hypothetical protein
MHSSKTTENSSFVLSPSPQPPSLLPPPTFYQHSNPGPSFFLIYIENKRTQVARYLKSFIVLRVGLSDPGMQSLSAANEHMAAFSWVAERLHSFLSMYYIDTYTLYYINYIIQTAEVMLCFLINNQFHGVESFLSA